jgi:hypothetical protein
VRISAPILPPPLKKSIEVMGAAGPLGLESTGVRWGCGFDSTMALAIVTFCRGNFITVLQSEFKIALAESAQNRRAVLARTATSRSNRRYNPA